MEETMFARRFYQCTPKDRRRE